MSMKERLDDKGTSGGAKSGMAKSRFKPYPKYKDSGIDWLGEIPEHWDLRRMKYISCIQPGKSKLRKLGDIEVSFIPMEYIGEFGTINSSETRQLNDVYEGYTFFEEGDILVAKITPCFENFKGAIARNLRNGIGFGTTELYVIRPSPNVHADFLAYMTYAAHFRQIGKVEMKGTAGQQRVPIEFIENFPCVLPPYSEQKEISDFLKRETKRIDDLVNAKQRLIELLKEKRAALINQAVTKGLDPNVPMKDSGIDWLGEIPEHWDVSKLKLLATVVTSNVDKKSYEGEQEVKLCNYTDVYNYEYITPDLDFMQATASPVEINKFKLREGDVLVTKDSEDWRDIAVPAFVSAMDDEDILCGYHLAILRPKQSIVDGEFLFRSLSSSSINYQFRLSATGITRYGLSKYWLDNSLILRPPFEEQNEIADFLREKTEEIEKLIEKIKNGLRRLKEYRSALITAAVTGKIDVRGE
ncbi:MAG: restriction endonuclease subunit S [Actinobacteria bacterium]|nr:restriction endonuclease subunit S [Actinomycetota bacterium]